MNNKKLALLMYIPIFGIFVPFYMSKKKNRDFFDEMGKPFHFTMTAFTQAISIFAIMILALV